MQQWIAPNGTSTVVALRRVWDLCITTFGYGIALWGYAQTPTHTTMWAHKRWCIPCYKVLPQVIRNGFDGKFYDINPIRLIAVLLSNPMAETMMKAGDVDIMKYFLTNPRTCDICWNSYKIAKRHGYTLNNISMWCDYIRMLNDLGGGYSQSQKHLSPRPQRRARCDNTTHQCQTKGSRRKNATKRNRKAWTWATEVTQRKGNEDTFIALKSKFFGLSNNRQRVDNKGAWKHRRITMKKGNSRTSAWFGAGYYRKENTLILSAKIDGQIVETVEIDLRTLKVVQCHGNKTDWVDVIKLAIKAVADYLR